jgi:hypothetical protein
MRIVAFTAALLCASTAVAQTGFEFGRQIDLTIYGGQRSTATTSEILLEGGWEAEDSYVVGGSVGTPFYRVGDDLQFEIEGALFKHIGEDDFWEFNGIFLARWKTFPWNHLFRTSIAIGDGLSWASAVPEVRHVSNDTEESSQVLNNVVVEVTGGVPEVPELNLVFRYHHRSGAFGTFGGVTDESTVFSLGLRYSLHY